MEKTLKQQLMHKIETAKETQKLSRCEIARQIGVKEINFQKWCESEKGSIVIADKLLKYFNLSIVEIL